MTPPHEVIDMMAQPHVKQVSGETKMIWKGSYHMARQVSGFCQQQTANCRQHFSMHFSFMSSILNLMICQTPKLNQPDTKWECLTS